jgi:hypothetical protein
MKDKKMKELMFCLSKSLPEIEAIQLALSMKTGDAWYIYKVGENPKAKHLADRVSFVVVRPLRKAEIIRSGYGILIDKEKLVKMVPDTRSKEMRRSVRCQPVLADSRV